MGWDAYATLNGDWFRVNHSSYEIIDKKFDAIFKDAYEKAIEVAGSTDGDLRTGGLNTTCCARELEKALGVSVWDDEPWPPEKLKSLSEKAVWKEPDNQSATWPFHSAKIFVETCVKHDLGVRFSF